MQLDFQARELTVKLVYYGPALSGKTTNLQALHDLSSAATRGRMMTLDTKDDRTLFFDMLPIVLKGEGDQGMSLRVTVFTVPGQVIHASTRRLVLQGADGVVFVADSQLTETENNGASFLELAQNLIELGRSVGEMPIVIQFNKRDLPKPWIRSDEEIDTLAAKGKEPVFKASAVTGHGVLESFSGLLDLTWKRLDAENDLRSKLGIDAEGFVGLFARALRREVQP